MYVLIYHDMIDQLYNKGNAIVHKSNTLTCISTCLQFFDEKLPWLALLFFMNFDAIIEATAVQWYHHAYSKSCWTFELFWYWKKPHDWLMVEVAFGGSRRCFNIQSELAFGDWMLFRIVELNWTLLTINELKWTLINSTELC